MTKMTYNLNIDCLFKISSERFPALSNDSNNIPRLDIVYNLDLGYKVTNESTGQRKLISSQPVFLPFMPGCPLDPITPIGAAPV